MSVDGLLFIYQTVSSTVTAMARSIVRRNMYVGP